MRANDAIRPWHSRYGDGLAERWLRVLPLVCYLSFIFIVSSVPGGDLAAVADDRLEHFGEYFVLGWLLILALAGFTPTGVGKVHYASAWMVGVAYAVSDELHQSFVPHRDASFGDVAFDSLGLTVALAVIAFLMRIRMEPS
ncbi:MAG TPA: VanZ family protein [Thermoanaerobaculia bacterium]|nr:VanZ family protein [Thermoanaerobaculia bacterium]